MDREVDPRMVELQDLLESIADRAYFQPPENIKMIYPCIVYTRDNSEVLYANNKPYRTVKRWQVTVIDENPDSTIPDKVEALPLCSFSRSFTADGLNHYAFNLFF